MNESWHIYQHALLLDGICVNQEPSMTEVRKALLNSNALFARWTSNYDCGYETEWWYCICDTFIPIEELSAKQRYRVKKGLTNCDIVQSATTQDIDDIVNIIIESFEDYPPQYRPKIDKKKMIDSLLNLYADSTNQIWIAIEKENKKIIGYGHCILKDKVVNLNQVKIPTKHLSKEVNAAMAYKICEHYLAKEKYHIVCDGERNIKHETQYQDFLIRVLNFRKAYCRLNIMYKPTIKCIVSMLYPVRSLFKAVGKISPLMYDAYCVLKQEQICRSFMSKQ